MKDNNDYHYSKRLPTFNCVFDSEVGTRVNGQYTYKYNVFSYSPLYHHEQILYSPLSCSQNMPSWWSQCQKPDFIFSYEFVISSWTHLFFRLSCESKLIDLTRWNSGLGHSLDQDSVMRPIYKGYSWANLKLGAKDIDGVEKLYGEDPTRFKKDGIFSSRHAFEGLTLI